MHAQITCTYHGWKTPFYYWKFHCPWETCAQEDDGSVLTYQGRCHFHSYPFIRHPSLGDAYQVVPVTTHVDGTQLSVKIPLVWCFDLLPMSWCSIPSSHMGVGLDYSR